MIQSDLLIPQLVVTNNPLKGHVFTHHPEKVTSQNCQVFIHCYFAEKTFPLLKIHLFANFLSDPLQNMLRDWLHSPTMGTYGSFIFRGYNP